MKWQTKVFVLKCSNQRRVATEKKKKGGKSCNIDAIASVPKKQNHAEHCSSNMYGPRLSCNFFLYFFSYFGPRSVDMISMPVVKSPS